ncbi:MAG: hypothetical protein ACPGVD_03405, partial [Flavobacteriales bacterium]
MGKPLHPFKIKFLATMLVGVFIATTQTLFAQPCVATDAVPPTVTYSTGSASVNGVIPFSSNDSILVVPIGNATAFSTASGSATYAPTVTDNCAYPGSLGSVVTETLPTPACGRRWTKTWTATDVAGNTRTSVQIITEGVVAGITGPTTACQNGPVQTLTGTMAGGTTNYTYTWTTDLGTIVDDSSGTASGNNSITTAKFTPGATSGTATVTLTVTDAGNGACVVTTTHTIVINDEPSQMVGFIDTSGVTTDGDVCIGHGITLFTTPSGGTMPYTHLWSPGGLTTDTISVSPAVTDTFFVMTTDANGCVDTSFHFVEVHPLPTITSVVVPTTCAGTDALVTLNGLPNTPSDTISIVMSLDTGGVNVLMDTTISGLSATNNTFLIRLPLTANTTTGTINIDTVRNDSTGCFIAGSPIVTTTFTIQGSPNILTIDSINGTPQDTLAIRDTVCIGDVGIVTLTGDWPTNGSYQITYNLSGANTFTGATATFNSGGIGTQQVVDAFTIPAAFLTNPGATDLQIVLIEDQGTGCAVPDTTTRTFHVISLPTITDIMVNDTCIGNAELTPAAVPPSDSTDLLVSITGLTPNGVFDIVYSVTGANTVALDTAINVNSNAGGDGSFIFNIPMANAGPNTVIIRQITDTTTKCVLGDTIVTSILADDPVTIHPIPDTTNLAIVMVEDTCIGIDHVGTVSGNLADGTYTLFYTLTVGNTGGGLTTTLTIANGTDSSFVIPATVLPDTSTTGNLTVITLDSIVNNATGCQTAQIVGVADSFAVQPVPVARIELAPDSSICTGDTIDVIVTLLEGDTSFTYTVDVSTGAASTSGNATITRTTVTSPDTLHLVEGVDFVGTTLFELTQIIDSNNCVNNSPDSSVLLIVNPVPTVDTLTVSVDDICLGDAATVTVLLEQQDGTTPLTTGTYAISYHLTGGNVRGPDTVTVTPNAMGIATFGIPADSLTGTIPSGLRTLIHIDSIANIATGCFSIYVDSQAMDSFRVVPPPTLDSIAWIADPCKNTPLYVDVYMSLDTANPTPPMVGDSFAITYNIVGDNVVATHTDTLVYTFSGDSIRMCIDSTNFQNAVPLASVTAGQGNTNIFTITHIRQLNFPLQCGQNVNDTTEFDVDPLPEGTPITIDPIADVCEGDSVQLFVRGLVPGRAYRIVYTAHSSQLTGNFSGALTTGNDTTGTLIANGSGAVSFFTDSLILLQDTMAVTPDSINIINVAFAGPDLFCDTTINRISAPFNVINRLQLDTISVDSAICFGDSVVVTLHGFTPKDSAVQVTYDLRGAVVATNVLDTIMPGDSTFTIFATALTSTGQVVVEVTDLEYTTVTPSCPQTLVGEIDTIIINVLPDTLSLGVTVTDGCFGDSVTVTITGLTPTTDYKFTFDVSHGNDSDTATEFVSDTLMSNVGGIITFNLPTGNLSTGNLERIDSSGAASLMIDSVLFTGTGCGIRIHVPVRDSFYLDSIPTIDSVWAGNICVGDSNVVNLTGLAPNIPAAPGITVEYYVDGPNTIGSMAARATATVGTDANGNAAFTITGANLPNANISIPDTVHIFRIINNASGCLDTVNLIDTFIVHPLPDPVLTTISIDDVCQGDSALIIINTGNLLNDSTYLITYEYDMNNNDVMDVGDTLTALVTISGPTDTIVIPAANLPTAAFPLNPEDSIDVRIIRIAYTDTLGCSIVTNIAAMFDHIPAPDSFTVNFRDSIICVNDTAWVNIDTVGLQDGTYNFYYTLIRGSGDTVNLTAPGVVIDGSLTPNGSFPVLSAFYGGNGVKYIRVDSLENVVQGCIRRVVSNMDSVFVDSLPNLTGLTISIGDICTDSIQTQPFSTLHLATSDSIRVDITNSNLAARDYCVVYSVYHPTIDSHLFLLDTVTIDTNGLGFFMVPGDSIASAAAADSSMTVHITVDSIYNSNLGCMCGVPVIGVRDSFLVHPNPLVDSMVVAVRDTSCYGDGTITVEIHTDFVSDTLANGTYQFIYLIDQNDSTGTTYEFRDTTGNVVINDDNGPGADGTFTVSTDSLGQTPLDSFANRRIRILGVINPVTGCFDSINTVIDSSFLYNHDPDTTNFMFTVSDTCENNYVRVSLNDNLDGAPNNAVRGRYIITYDLDVNNDGTYDSIGLQQGHIASDTTFYLDSTITLNITTATTMVMKITAIQDTLVDSTTCGISNLCLTDTFVIYPNPEEVTFDDVVAGCSTGDSVGIIVNNAQPGIIYNIGIARGNPVIDTVTYTISNTTGSTTNLLWKIAKTDVDSLLTNQAASVTANGYAIVHVLAYSINSNGDTLCPLVMADSVRFLDSTIMLGQPTLTPSDIELCETETSTITSTIYTGTTVVYDWSNSEPGHGIANTIVLNNNQIVTQPHDSGVYTIRLTVFVDGCATNESEVNITVHTPPVVTPQAFDIKCGDPDSLVLEPIVAYLNAPATFQWTGPAGFSSVNPTDVIYNPTSANTGTYTLVVTDSVGCTTQNSVTVLVTEDISQPVITSTPVGKVCENTSVTLNATTYTDPQISSVIYAWTLPNGMIDTTTVPQLSGVASIGAPNAGQLQAGNYSVEVTVVYNNNPGDFCSKSSGTFVLDVDSIPTVVISIADSVLCEGENLVVTVDTPANVIQYTWVGPNGFTQTSTTTGNLSLFTLTPPQAGTYTLTVQTAAGCSASFSKIITVTPTPSQPTITASDADLSICNNEAITLTSPIYSGTSVEYRWTGPGAPSGTSLNQITVSPQGDTTYSLIISVNGCLSDTAFIAINVDSVPTFTTGITTNITDPCVDGTDSLVLNSNVVATTGQTFSWTGPNGFTSTEATPVIQGITSLNSGTYTVKVSTPTGCEAEQATFLTFKDEPGAPALTATELSICLGESTTLSIPTYNGIIVSYDWFNNPVNANAGLPSATNNNTITVTPNAIGTYIYQVAVTVNGCTSDTSSIIVVVNANPALVLDTLVVNCAVTGTNLNLGTAIDMGASTGLTNPTTYMWVGPNGFSAVGPNPTINNISSTHNGVYTLTATNADGCSDSESFTVAVTDGVPTVTVTASDDTPCTGDIITITATDFSSDPSLSYAWSATAGNATTRTVNVTALAGATTYTVTVTRAGTNCISVDSVVVTGEDAPNIVLLSTASDITCLDGTTDVTIDANVTGASSYSWTGPNGFFSTDQNALIGNATSANSGPYVLTATSANNGCTSTSTFTLTITDEPAAPTLTASDLNICLGEQVTLTGTNYNVGTIGSITYNWTGTGLPLQTQSNQIVVTPTLPVFPATTQTYTYSVTIDGCVSETGSVTISVEDAPLITAITTASDTTCLDGTTNILLEVDAANPNTFDFLWSGPNGFSSTLEDPTIVNATSANSGIYTVTATSGNGCTTTLSQDLEITDQPQNPTLSVDDATICLGESVILTGTNYNVSTGTNISYTWTAVPNAGLPAGDQFSTLVATPTAVGSYTYQYSVTIDGCTSTIGSVSVTVEDTPTITIAAITGNVCVDGTTDIALDATNTGTQAITYAWSGPNGFSANTLDAIIVNATSADNGQYTLVSTSANGCQNVTSINVDITDEPVAPTLNVSDATICDGESITLTGTNYTVPVSGNITYNWAVTSLGSGNGGLPTALNSSTIVATPNGADTYTYTYSATIEGCQSDVTSIVVVVEDAPTIAPFATGDTTCVDGTTDMSLFANSTGTPVVTWAWSGPAGFTSNIENPIVSNITAANSGTYTLVATSANGCMTTNNVNVNITDEPTNPTLTASDMTICLGETTTLTGTPYSIATNGSISYNWSVNVNGGLPTNTDASTLVAEPTAAGTYTYVYSVTVDGCQSTDASVTVIVEDAPTIAPSVTGDLTCVDGTTDMQLFANVTPPPAVVTYAWSGPSGFTSNIADPIVSNITSANSGTYTLVATSANGCTTTELVDIDITDEPANPTLGVSDATICLGESVILTGTPYNVSTGGSSGIITYNWSQTANGGLPTADQLSTLVATPTAAGTIIYTYSVTIDGCQSADATVTITVQDAPTIDPQIVGNLTCVDGTTDAQLQANSTGTPVITWVWSGPNGFSSSDENPILSNITSANSGTYTLTATSANGCTTTDNVNVNI